MPSSEELEEPESPPPPPGANKVELTVAGHTVVVESSDPLADVVGYALGLFEQTSGPARHDPMGFTATGGQFERADDYVEPYYTSPYEGEDSHAGRVDGHQRDQPPGTASRRLGIDDPPGGHRTRLWQMSVDPEQRPLP